MSQTTSQFTMSYMGPNGVIKQPGVVPNENPIKSASSGNHQEWPIYTHNKSEAFYNSGTREIKWISGSNRVLITGASAQEFISYCERNDRGESWYSILSSIESNSQILSPSAA